MQLRPGKSRNLAGVPPATEGRPFELISAFEFSVDEFENSEYMESMSFAIKHKVSVYDASYHVLAMRLGCSFMTADRKFFNKVKGLGVVELLPG